MCGITGFLTSAAETELELKICVSRMTDQLAHRGPDDSSGIGQRVAGVHRAVCDLPGKGTSKPDDSSNVPIT